MRLEYGVLWFEDNSDSFDILSKKLQRFVENEYGFTCKFGCYDVREYSEIDREDFSSANLVLVDLNLSESIQGNELVNHLREKSIFAPTILYSSADIHTVKKAMLKSELEGVYCTSRSELLDKAQSIISATISRMQNLNNLRGFIMGECSAIETKMGDILLKYGEVYGNERLKALCLPTIKQIEKNTKKKLKCIHKEKKCIHIFRNSPITTVVKKQLNAATKAELVVKVMKEIFGNEDFEFDYGYIRKVRNELAHAEEDEKTSSLILNNGSKKSFSLEEMKAMRQKIKLLREQLEKLETKLS